MHCFYQSETTGRIHPRSESPTFGGPSSARAAERGPARPRQNPTVQLPVVPGCRLQNQLPLPGGHILLLLFF